MLTVYSKQLLLSMDLVEKYGNKNRLNETGFYVAYGVLQFYVTSRWLQWLYL